MGVGEGRRNAGVVHAVVEGQVDVRIVGRVATGRWVEGEAGHRRHADGEAPDLDRGVADGLGEGQMQRVDGPIGIQVRRLVNQQDRCGLVGGHHAPTVGSDVVSPTELAQRGVGRDVDGRGSTGIRATALRELDIEDIVVVTAGADVGGIASHGVAGDRHGQTGEIIVQVRVGGDADMVDLPIGVVIDRLARGDCWRSRGDGQVRPEFRRRTVSKLIVYADLSRVSDDRRGRRHIVVDVEDHARQRHVGESGVAAAVGRHQY